MLEVGGIVGGKFRIERLLGKGGMGIVAVATHLQLDQLVALKVLHDEMAADPDVVERFMREARASARLRSEHVCRVSDVGQLEDGSPYLVMELLEGRDLSQVLADGTLPVDVAADYVVQACVAVAEAHALGIVHRDLKPANLFLTNRLDGSPLIKVLDFGIAKASSATELKITKTATIMGSPGYMSPEQLRSTRDVDLRSDIWALGVILYELASGQLPFRAESITELAVKVVVDPPEPLVIAAPAFTEIVYRCLEKEPDHRFGSVVELASALAPLGSPATGQTAALIATLATRSGLVAVPPVAMSRLGHATTLQTAAAQRTGSTQPAVGEPPRKRKWPLMLGGGALVVGAAVAAALVVGHGTSPATATGSAAAAPGDAGAVLAVGSGSAGSAGSAEPAAPADAAASVTSSAELRAKLTQLAAKQDWYAVLQLADLDRGDPDVASIVKDAKQHYLLQQTRAVEAAVKAGQCARAKELADAALQVVPDDVSLGVQARECKLRASVPPAPPAPPPTITDANQAYKAGEFAKAFDLADRLAKADASDIAAARVATEAGCNLKDVDKATRYASRLHGAEHTAARVICRKNSIDIGPPVGSGSGSSSSPGLGSGSGEPDEDEIGDHDVAAAQSAARRGDFAKAFSLAESALSRQPRNPAALSVGLNAACHLKDAETARLWLRRLPMLRQRSARQQCAQLGVNL